MAKKQSSTPKAESAKKAPAKKVTAKVTKKAPKVEQVKAQEPGAQEKPKRSPRWSIGCFRNEKEKLVTVYVNAAGEPMPYEMRRVGSATILFHGVYADMKYSEARQQLLKDAAKQGIKDEAEAPAKPSKKAAPKKPKATKKNGAAESTDA